MNTPERRREQAPERRRVPRGGRRDGDQPGRFPRLLVADSYEGARIPCVRYLHRLGFLVDEASDGDEALAKIEAAPPRVILVESGLPNAPVSQLVRHLRARPETRSVPVIVMMSDLESAAGGVAGTPHVSVLAKPFALSVMLQEIRRLLREQAALPPASS